MRESLPLVVSLAPLQEGQMEVNEEREGGRDASTLKEQYGKSARRINARNDKRMSRREGERNSQEKNRNWRGLDIWRNLHIST